MKEYVVNFILMLFATYIVATLSFLIAAEFSVAAPYTAVIGGILGGFLASGTYQLGRLHAGKFDAIILVVQLVASLFGGFLGGWQMTL